MGEANPAACTECCRQWQPAITMLVISFIFGSGNVLLKRILTEGANHLVIVTYRQAIAALSLAPIAYFWERSSRPPLTAYALCLFFFSALVGITVTQSLFLLGLQRTSSTFSCAFINAVPVLTFILALPFKLEQLDLKRKGGKAKALGTVICIGGFVMLVLYKGMPLTNHQQLSPPPPPPPPPAHDQVNHIADKWTAGSMFLIAGCICWSSWFLLQARISNIYPCPYYSNTIMSFFSVSQSAMLNVIVDRRVTSWAVTGKMELLTIAYVGTVASGLCYVGMSWCVKQKGPVFTAAFTPFTQIFAAMFDFGILREQVHLGSVLGSVLVIAGMYILLLGKNMEAKECSVKQVQAGTGSSPSVQVHVDISEI